MQSTIYRRGRRELQLLAMVLEWHLGDVVRKIRELKGYDSQEALGAAAGGLDKGTINRLEKRGEEGSTPQTIRRVASVLDVPVSELYALVPSATGNAPVSDETRERDVLWERIPVGPSRRVALANLRRQAELAVRAAAAPQQSHPPQREIRAKEKGTRRGKRGA